MANSKISALTSATTPLAGTETLPVVQSSTTKQVSVANLTAGRAVSAASLALTTSPLPVTSGGTGTATAFTTGSVAFAGASGVYSQDNTNLFWDASNLRLGIGGNTPVRRLQIDAATGGPGLRITNTNSNSGIEILTSATKYSWLLGAQYNVGDAFEITASTAVGGTTFSTPLVTVTAPSGDVGVKTGNLSFANGKGIDFSATPGTGTSELLADYEEGTWTPTATGGLTVNSATYTKVGRQVTLMADVTAVALTSGDITGLPFTNGPTNASGVVAYQTNTALVTWGVIIDASTTNMSFRLGSTQQQLSAGKRAYFSVAYFV
jgi:hypothetical protein